ncbi:hypothetical protein Tco_0519362 [Tanacetum coccineum]
MELILQGQSLEFDDPQDYSSQPYLSAAYGIHPFDIEERRSCFPQELYTLWRMHLPSYVLVSGNHSGECVPPYLKSFLQSSFEMSSEDCLECSDSGSDLCIKESAPASLVSVICHPVEVRAGCCLEADASDSLGFFELWSSSFGGGLADPEAAESDLLFYDDYLV